MASTLLMKLIATDDRPFTTEVQKANSDTLNNYLNALKAGTSNFEVARYLTNAINYTHGFMKAGLVNDDIGDRHQEAAVALGTAFERKPWKCTEEEASKISVVLDIWKDILSQASENLVREIQHQIDVVHPQAKELRDREKMRRNQKRKKRK